MILHQILFRAGIVEVTPTSADDLWTLRRIIAAGDYIETDTRRVAKQKGEFQRPDKGERIKVRIVLEVERAGLDSQLDRLRISGKIRDVSTEFLAKGSFHSIIVTPNHRLTLRKQRWSEVEKRLLSQPDERNTSFVIVAIDSREAGVGRVDGTHLQLYPSVQSGQSGKQYNEPKGIGAGYFKRVEHLVQNIGIGEAGMFFIAGPGLVKNQFSNYLTTEMGDNMVIRLLEGVDLSGEDGVYSALRSKNLRDVLEGSKLAKVLNLLEEAVKRLSTKNSSVSIGLKDCLKAAQDGSVEAVIISDKIFEGLVNEDLLVKFLNLVEKFGGESFMVDHTTDAGKQATALGGAVALLRYGR